MDNFGLILKKELTDIVRDKRSFVMLFIPILLFPIMFTLMGTQLKDSGLISVIVACKTERDRANYDSFLQFIDDANEYAQREGMDTVEIKEIEKGAGQDALDVLKNGKAAAILSFSDGALIVTPSRVTTQAQQEYLNLNALLSGWITASESQKALTEHGVDVASLSPVVLRQEDPVGKGSSALATIAPMILVMLILNGGVSVAVDLFTGEKERGTFESLLTTQTSRLSILAAKFTATLIVSLASMILSIAAYMISFRISPSAAVLMGGSGSSGSMLEESGLDAFRVFALLGVCLSLSVFAVSLLTLIALRARTVKEAQSQTSLLTIFGSLLGGGIAFMNVAEVGTLPMLIPIYNVIVTIKLLFSDMSNIGIKVIVTMASCFAYSAILWILSARLLRSEKLLRG